MHKFSTHCTYIVRHFIWHLRVKNLCIIQIDAFLCESGLLIIALFPRPRVSPFKGHTEKKLNTLQAGDNVLLRSVFDEAKGEIWSRSILINPLFPSERTNLCSLSPLCNMAELFFCLHWTLIAFLKTSLMLSLKLCSNKLFLDREEEFSYSLTNTLQHYDITCDSHLNPISALNSTDPTFKVHPSHSSRNKREAHGFTKYLQSYH